MTTLHPTWQYRFPAAEWDADEVAVRENAHALAVHDIRRQGHEPAGPATVTMRRPEPDEAFADRVVLTVTIPVEVQP